VGGGVPELCARCALLRDVEAEARADERRKAREAVAALPIQGMGGWAALDRDDALAAIDSLEGVKR
jgi:hypothetical protein